MAAQTRQILPVLTAIKVYIKLFKDLFVCLFFSFQLNKQPLKREKIM